MDFDETRAPPRAIEAEECVLSAILLDHRVWDIVAPILSPEAFYVDANRSIYAACNSLASRSQPIDITTVANELGQRLAAIGGLVYISRLLDTVPVVANVAAYCRLINDKWLLRRTIECCGLISAHAYKGPPDVKVFVDKAERAIYDLARGSSGAKDPLHVYDLSLDALTRLQSAAERGGNVAGVSTGFKALDDLTTGMHPGELIVVAARPGMGKTGYATQLALNVSKCAHDGKKCGSMIFSLEMPKEQIMDRILASEARVSMKDLRTGQVHGDAWDRLVEASSRVSSLPVWIDDTSDLTVMELRSKIRRQQAKLESLGGDCKLGCVVVDYIQLMRSAAQSREQEISEISRGLKSLAKDFKVPVIALSQLNRAVENRQVKKPQLSDLRESGAIEQDADVVQFIFRPEYYANQAGENVPRDDVGVAEIIVAKQRNGPTDTVRLGFEAHCVRFKNVDK